MAVTQHKSKQYLYLRTLKTARKARTENDTLTIYPDSPECLESYI